MIISIALHDMTSVWSIFQSASVQLWQYWEADLCSGV